SRSSGKPVDLTREANCWRGPLPPRSCGRGLDFANAKNLPARVWPNQTRRPPVKTFPSTEKKKCPPEPPGRADSEKLFPSIVASDRPKHQPSRHAPIRECSGIRASQETV